MTELAEVLSARSTDLREAVRLEEVEAAKDPEEEPFRSQYAARAIFAEVLASLPAPEEPRARAVAAALTSRLGANLFDTEERPEGEAKLLAAVKSCSEAIAESAAVTPLFVSTLMAALNTLGRLFSAREAFKEALGWLRRSEQLYGQFREEHTPEAPASFEGLLGLEEEKEGEWRRFEALHTKTLYFLAQVHCKIEGDAAISAHYCGATLSRQLAAGDFEPLDWCLNAGGLSQFFLTRCRFAAARHCLASAEAMFRRAESQRTEAAEAADDALLQARADLHRCWAKYALFLLDPASVSAGEADSAAEKEKQMREEAEAAPSFTELAGVEEFEALIGCARPDSLETARPFFLFAQERLERAKKHYLLEEHCSDHVAVVQDHSRAFRLLAEHWEPQVERQCRMHKRRLDMLRVLIDALNPQHFLMLCRQLLFEVGETFQAMVTAKLSALPTDGTAKEKLHAIRKVNSLVTEGISFYQHFVESYRRPNGDMPEELPADETRPVLLAYFNMGHLHSKRLELEKGKRIREIEASLTEYRKLVDYCDRFPAARERVPVELDLAKEMVQLLPGKIRQVALERDS